ncbi:acetylcholinesterase-1 [Trichonephila clavipes]|nr:acetylcholinesterase-1 [Trichonephila clavipes]
MGVKIFKFLLVYEGIVLAFSNNLNNEPVVRIDESRIIGQSITFQDSEVYQYLGIPYAEPPIGELRFMPTVPICQQPKKLNALKQPPACIQYTENPFPWYENPSDMSEDCLYLNIWVPSDACPKNKKAVMYWMHGGGFRYGSIRSKLYNGTVLAALGDIVVVTVNYRMGPFGFLFSSSEDAPGNAGLWDVLEGLKWINKNIGFFGGDSSRITISGESAGAMFISLLSTSPLAKGLYSKQIMQSGVAIFLQIDTMRQQNLNNSQKIAKIVKCANDTNTIQNNPGPVVECLKSNSV